MKRADRELALKAHRLRTRKHDSATIARKLDIRERCFVITKRGVIGAKISDKLGLPDPERAHDLAENGRLILRFEGYRLTKNEALVMKALARVEARRVHLVQPRSCEAKDVDFAVGKRSGWTAGVVKKRLRTARLTEHDPGTRLDLLVHTERNSIWLTPAGWAFVWATGLILQNWKVPL